MSSSTPADSVISRRGGSGPRARKLALPRTIARHDVLEFLLTLVLLFGVVTFVGWVICPSAYPAFHL